MCLSIIGVGFYFIYTIIEPHRIYSYAKLLLHQFSSFLELILRIEHTMGPRKTNKNKTMNGNLWFHWLTNLYGNQCLKCFNGKKSNHTKTTTVLGKVQATYVSSIFEECEFESETPSSKLQSVHRFLKFIYKYLLSVCGNSEAKGKGRRQILETNKMRANVVKYVCLFITIALCDV